MWSQLPGGAVFDRVNKWWRGRRVPRGREEELRRLERRLAKIQKREQRSYRRRLRDERILLNPRRPFFGEGRPRNHGGWERMENKLNTRRMWQRAALAVSVVCVLIVVLELLHVH
jgi:hypothetical protein